MTSPPSQIWESRTHRPSGKRPPTETAGLRRGPPPYWRTATSYNDIRLFLRFKAYGQTAQLVTQSCSRWHIAAGQPRHPATEPQAQIRGTSPIEESGCPPPRGRVWSAGLVATCPGAVGERLIQLDDEQVRAVDRTGRGRPARPHVGCLQPRQVPDAQRHRVAVNRRRGPQPCAQVIDNAQRGVRTGHAHGSHPGRCRGDAGSAPTAGRPGWTRGPATGQTGSEPRPGSRLAR